MNKKITQQCNFSSHQQNNNTSLQNTKSQPLHLSDEGSIYRCLARVWVMSGFLISVFPLVVLGSTWRFHDVLLILGWIQRGKCHRISLWKIPWSSTFQNLSAICLFSLITPHKRPFEYASHLASGAIYMVQFWPVLSSFFGGTSGKWCNQLTMILYGMKQHF